MNFFGLYSFGETFAISQSSSSMGREGSLPFKFISHVKNLLNIVTLSAVKGVVCGDEQEWRVSQK